MDYEEDDFDRSSGSELDSDIESSLYSRIYHEHNPDQAETPNGDLTITLTHLNTFWNSDNTHISQTSSFTSSPPALNLSCEKKSPDVVTVWSSDECEIIDSEMSKYSSSKGKRPRKRPHKKAKIVEVEVISSDDEEFDNLYIHLDGNESSSKVIDTIDVPSDSEPQSADHDEVPVEVVDGPSTSSENQGSASSAEVVQSSEVGDSSALSVRERLVKEMNDFYNIHTANDLCNVSAQQIIASLEGHDWFVSSFDRRRQRMSKCRFYKENRYVCGNCKQRGHMANACPEPKRMVCCHICGGTHKGERCYKRCCDLCWKPGHVPVRCPEKQRISKLHCRICKCYGHSARFCSDLWRKYHITTEAGPAIVSPSSLKSTGFSYCSNCSQKGHFVHQCDKELVNEFTCVHRPDIVSYSGLLATPDHLKLEEQIDPVLETSEPKTEIVYSERHKAIIQLPIDRGNSKLNNKMTKLLNGKLHPKKPLNLQNYFINPKTKKRNMKKKTNNYCNRKKFKFAVIHQN